MRHPEYQGGPLSAGALLWNTDEPVHKSAPRPVTLHSCLHQVRPGLSYLRESLKLSVRAGVHHGATRIWLPYWNSSPLLSELARAQPGVLKKIYRPYLSRRLRCAERLDVLTSHYARIALCGLGELVLRAARAPVRLTELTGKSGQAYQLELVAMERMEREGELVLQLASGGVVLFSVAFTFLIQDGSPAVAIGCLQGGRADDALELIRSATRELHGLRPKTLMVRLVQQIGRQFGCHDLLLVGNDNRVVQQQLRKGLVMADYDSTWVELGASRRYDGDFRLPCAALAEPELAAIASNKRSEAKKRFALLTAVAGATCAALLPVQAGSPGRTAPAQTNMSALTKYLRANLSN
ncbi:MAG: DUF535 family protein [Pseudomonadota bacterium]